MKKSTLVAQFIIYRSGGLVPNNVQTQILLAYSEQFPIGNFSQWDREIDTDWAATFFLKYKDDVDADLPWIISGLTGIE